MGTVSESPVSTTRGLWLWSKERFPLAQGIVVAVLYGAAVQFSRALCSHPKPPNPLHISLGFLACWSVFLLLRIFDEHKDYTTDQENHPQRVLQRGLITLKHLRVLAVLSLVAPSAYSWLCDGGWGRVGILWLCVLGWASLMAAEFFVPVWLNRHLLLYGFSHLLIMPLLLAWLMLGSLPSAESIDTLVPAGGWLLLLGLFAGCSYELTRKAWGAEEEKTSIPSYSRQLGTSRVALCIAFCLAIPAAASAMILRLTLGSSGLGWALAPLLGWAVTLWPLLQYTKNPCARTRKRNEAWVGLSMLLAYGTPFAVLGLQ